MLFVFKGLQTTAPSASGIGLKPTGRQSAAAITLAEVTEGYLASLGGRCP